MGLCIRVGSRVYARHGDARYDLLGWECADFLGNVSDLYPLYEQKLQTICGWLNESGNEWLSESLYQLEADMDAFLEDT